MTKTDKKTGADRTQRAVRDEWWSDERVRSFLTLESPQGAAPDYHILISAYRGMVPEAFQRFVDFFTADGRNLNENGPDGRTVLQIISEHRNSTEYAAILKQAGAH